VLMFGLWAKFFQTRALILLSMVIWSSFGVVRKSTSPKPLTPQKKKKSRVKQDMQLSNAAGLVRLVKRRALRSQ
jgi:hypothetical protein